MDNIQGDGKLQKTQGCYEYELSLVPEPSMSFLKILQEPKKKRKKKKKVPCNIHAFKINSRTSDLIKIKDNKVEPT